MLREEDRHFLWSMYSAAAIILAWKGVWEGIYVIPVVSDVIGDPFVFLFIGLTMLTFSGLVFKEFDPLGGMEKALVTRFEGIMAHPQKNQFKIKYYDKVQKKEVEVPAVSISQLDETALIVVLPTKQEFFIPIHRVKKIFQNDKIYWRA
ncbi:DUF504 domain-containing protein [Candidatus Woesearchaeota archaeon]|nr:DUF504 domain-containing protein [Candidatus Woesearchaeota archaeon]